MCGKISLRLGHFGAYRFKVSVENLYLLFLEQKHEASEKYIEKVKY
jgi:hypothetical protein